MSDNSHSTTADPVAGLNSLRTLLEYVSAEVDKIMQDHLAEKPPTVVETQTAVEVLTGRIGRRVRKTP